MADNTLVKNGNTGGTDYTVAADDIGSAVMVQRIKLIHGIDGVNDGDVSTANGLPVIPQPRCATTVITPAIGGPTPYSSGDVIGVALTITAAFASGGSGQIISATLIDKAKQKAALELWVFKVTPTLVNGDNGVFDIIDANMVTAKPVCIIDFAAANYADNNSNSVCCGSVRGTPGGSYVTSGSANLFGVFVVRGTPTYTSSSDLVLEITVNEF